MAERRIKIKKGPFKFPRENFFDRVDTSGGPDACRPWMAGRISTGYGSFYRDGIHILAHRDAYEIANGPIPAGKHVLHSCDNPPCCNARHLFLGTQRLNVDDMNKKGRQARGERHGHAKFSDAVVAEAIAAYRRGEGSCAMVGRRFGMSAKYLQRIVSGKRRSNPFTSS